MVIKFKFFLFYSCFGEILDIKLLNCTVNILNQYEIRLESCKSREYFLKIDNLLEQHKTISKLSIVDSKLSKFPLFICNLTELLYLDLSLNNILNIPEGCFKNKKTLITLNLDHNEITELRDGTFDGMKNLKKISFTSNKINYIGSKVFSNVSDLSNLNQIYLSKNRLTSLDAWPFLRATYTDDLEIYLDFNQIAEFTNYLEWKYDCIQSNKSSNFKFTLNNNKIQHLNSLISAYFDTIPDMMCFYSTYIKEEGDDNQLFLNNNPFYCNCVDYSVKKYIKDVKNITFLNALYCDEPEKLKGGKVNAVNLEELICDVPIESHCPPECECKKQPYNGTFHVICSSKQLTSLPHKIPSTKTSTKTFAQYKLIFQNNSIEHLDPRYYFNETIWLDLSHAKIKYLDKETWTSIKNITQIFLHNNHITILPKIVIQEPGNFEYISLYNNPIECNCENIWFRDWLMNKRDKISRLDSIICDTPYWLKGKSIIRINNEEFCTDPYNKKDQKITYIIVFSFLSILILLIILCALVYYYRVSVYKIINIHPFDRDECTGEEMQYDIFISCSDEDRVIAIELVGLFEKRGYVICYREKDFTPGVSIDDNINVAIKTSRRTICLISEAFINCSTCMLEFDLAYHLKIQNKRNRLIIVLIQPVELIHNIQSFSALNEFIKFHTYFKYESIGKGDYNNLLYAMPSKPLYPAN